MRAESWRPALVYKPLKRNVVFYHGPSRLNGDDILVIGTAQNGNRKIGAMLQLWIMPAISPIEAVRTGRDAAVCGDCALRGDGHGKSRVCYVEWWRSVENIWQSSARADVMTPSDFAREHSGLQLRIGAYGDPVAVPMHVWQPLLDSAAGWTAYTHQWRTQLAHEYQSWCMASVETHADQLVASRLGWRTFRVRPEDGALSSSEVVCPHEQNESIKCASCELCRGASRQAKHIVVTVHGSSGRKYFPLTLSTRAEQRA